LLIKTTIKNFETSQFVDLPNYQKKFKILNDFS